jgi:hypothetical protein
MLQEIQDVHALLKRQVARCHEHPIIAAPELGFDRAMLKFREHGLNEALGYELARLVGVPTPRAVGIWSSSEATEATGIGPGSVGVAVEFHDSWRWIGEEDAAEVDREAVGSALALCVFDRHEWGEFGVVKGHIMFVDLERILPGLLANHLLTVDGVERAACLARAGDNYRTSSEYFATEAIEGAIRLGVLDVLSERLERMAALHDSDYLQAFDLGTHPLAPHLVSYLVRHTRQRLNVSLSVLAAHSSTKLRASENL